MGNLVEFGRVYRRVESSDRGSDALTTVLPSIEVIGNTSVSVYGSNLPRSLYEITNDINDSYTPPISDSEIIAKMTLTTSELLPGFHASCTCTTWIAFIANVLGDPPLLYDCNFIDWTFEENRIRTEENC